MPLRTWRGHRVFAADVSKVHSPHELLLSGYKAPNRDQYYPQGLMSTIYLYWYDSILTIECNFTCKPD